MNENNNNSTNRFSILSLSKEELIAYYTGGNCYEFARYIYEVTGWPIIEFSGIRNWDGTIIDRTWYHFTNWHPYMKGHIDATGVSTPSYIIQQNGWDEEDDIRIEERSLEYLIAAGSQEIDVFGPDWFENVVLATRILKIDHFIQRWIKEQS